MDWPDELFAFLSICKITLSFEPNCLQSYCHDNITITRLEKISKQKKWNEFLQLTFVIDTEMVTKFKLFLFLEVTVFPLKKVFERQLFFFIYKHK